MRSLFVTLFLMAALAAQARLSLSTMEHFIVSGSEYVRLDNWAGGAGFEMKWLRQQGKILLTSRTGRAQLTVDSRRAEIGGVNVWLSLPVVNRSGTVLISLVDAEKTIGPILFPEKPPARLRMICLDPGHGGKDRGEVTGRNYEKTYTLLLARDVAELLEREGLKVCLTRDGDNFVELPLRAETARRRGADLLVSLHYNSAERGIRGLEVYCLAPAGFNSSNDGGGKSARPRETGNAHDDENVLLAYELDRAITASLPMEDRGIKRARFEVLREALMPAILIEGGFMSNALDARNIYDAAFRKRMARAIVNGILAYKKVVERL